MTTTTTPDTTTTTPDTTTTTPDTTTTRPDTTTTTPTTPTQTTPSNSGKYYITWSVNATITTQTTTAILWYVGNLTFITSCSKHIKL
jgi:hypothetical protein